MLHAIDARFHASELDIDLPDDPCIDCQVEFWEEDETNPEIMEIYCIDRRFPDLKIDYCGFSSEVRAWLTKRFLKTLDTWEKEHADDHLDFPSL